MQRLAVVGSLVLSLGLAACGGDGSSSSSGASTGSAVQSGASASAASSTSTSTAHQTATSTSSGSLAGNTQTAPAVASSGVQAQAQVQSTTTAAAFSLSGNPVKTAEVGVWYSFLPTVVGNAADAHLTFSVVNAPRWATLNTITGEVSGTPGTDDVGTYANIKISATNGTSTETFPAFTVVVGRATAVSLSWAPPLTNTDGTKVTGLAGYTIYYGRASTSMTESVTVANPGTRTFELANLSTGQWYISVVAYSSSGTISAKSTIVHVTI